MNYDKQLDWSEGRSDISVSWMAEYLQHDPGSLVLANRQFMRPPYPASEHQQLTQDVHEELDQRTMHDTFQTPANNQAMNGFLSEFHQHPMNDAEPACAHQQLMQDVLEESDLQPVHDTFSTPANQQAMQAWHSFDELAGFTKYR